MELSRALKADKAYPLLFAVALVALAFRITTLRFDNLLLGSDPWYHYKIAKILLETGEYPLWEYYTRYPFGEAVIAPPGFYYLPVMLYKLLAFTGMSFFRIFQVLPALMGFLTVVPLYLLVKELFNKKIGVAASLFFAISPAGIERGLAGFYRGEVFLVFTMLFALYFFVLSIKRNLYFSLPSGVFLFFGGTLWNGWPFAFGVLLSAAGLGVLQCYHRGSSATRLLTSYATSSTIGIVLLYLFRSSFYRYERTLAESEVIILGFKLLLLAALFLALINYIGTRLKERNYRLAVLALLFISIGGIGYNAGIITPLNEHSRIFDTTKGVALKETTTYVWRTGITEQAKTSLAHLIYMYNVLLLLSPLGLVYLFKEKKNLGTSLVLAFALSILPLLALQIRFIFLGAVPLSMMGAIALPLFTQNRKHHVKNAVAVFFVMLIYLNILAATSYTSSARPFVSEALYDGLVWASENTPEDSVILAWWDYSGPIAAIAERRSVAHTAPSGMVESFSLLMRTSNESQAIEVFKSLNEDFSLRDMRADYLIVDTRTYLLWPKMLKFEPYVNYQIRVENKELADSMLHRLYTAKNLSRFELVYANADFRLYRPLFNYTKIASIEASRYYKAGKTAEFEIIIKSNERDRVILRMSVLKEGRALFEAEEEIDANSRYKLKLPLDEPLEKGRYELRAELYSLAGVKLHVLRREFIII